MLGGFAQKYQTVLVVIKRRRQAFLSMRRRADN
jgi:hypothetical protein